MDLVRCYNPGMHSETDADGSLILVSACLLGVACRYDGQSCATASLIALASHGRVVPICPEVAGGLPTPRLPAEIEGAGQGLDGHAVLAGRTRVMRSDGTDVTAHFFAGADAAYSLVQHLGLRRAILKANSPSCGAGHVYEGRFGGTLVPGDGVTAARLKRAGLEVFTEDTWLEGDA